MKPLQRTPKPELSGRRTAGRAQRDGILDPYQSRSKTQGTGRLPQLRRGL